MMAKVEVVDDVLLCPGCGGDNVHHCDVFVYCREEDAPDVVFARVCGADGGNPEVEAIVEANELVQNPSRRRGGMAVRFWCEACFGVYALTIAQHRGETRMHWQSETHLHFDGETISVKLAERGDVD